MFGRMNIDSLKYRQEKWGRDTIAGASSQEDLHRPLLLVPSPQGLGTPLLLGFGAAIMASLG